MIEDTSGFYMFDPILDMLIYAPDAVYFPDGSVIVETLHDTYTYPYNGWYYFESKLLAEEFFGIAVLLNA